MSEEQGRRNLLSDLRWGAIWGLLIALCLNVILAVMAVIHGPQLFERYATSFPAVAVLYLGGGLLGGLVVGLFRPLSRWRLGGAAMGVMAALPIGLGVRLMRSGLAPWEMRDTLTLAIFALALGGTIGWVYWGIFKGPGSQWSSGDAFRG